MKAAWRDSADEAGPGERREVDRRTFLERGVWLLAGPCLGTGWFTAVGDEGAGERSRTDGVFRLGLVTDLHHADKPAAGSRHYRDTEAKLEEAGAAFRAAGVGCVIELGDLIDAADSVALELRHLRAINGVLSQITPDRHYVLGNHCVDTLTKEEFLGEVGREKAFHSFDRGGWHFVVLDACFRSDGRPYGRRNFEWTDANVPAAELEWLAGDLKATRLPVVVCVHQRLDDTGPHGVRNAAAVREVLEGAGSVRAVLQGHSHQNDLREIEGIPYCTLVAMVEGSGPESSGYGVLEAHADGSLVLRGFRRQAGRGWPRA